MDVNYPLLVTTGITKHRKEKSMIMDKQPAFYVGVDQFTVVLRFVGQLDDLESWPAQVKKIVDSFVRLSELETFFGKLVPGRGNRPVNYTEALTYDTVPW